MGFAFLYFTATTSSTASTTGEYKINKGFSYFNQNQSIFSFPDQSAKELLLKCVSFYLYDHPPIHPARVNSVS